MMESISPDIRRKWIILPIEASSALNIEFKLPSNIKKCIGIYFSVKGYYGPDVQQAGSISLEFNNRKTNPVSQIITYNPAVAWKKISTLKLNEPLIPNSIITGCYYSFGIVTPYNVQIYLECLTDKN